jgi:hypothetical protein
MANELKVVISAVDRTTASVRRINERIATLTRPISAVRRSVTDLGREMGLDKVSASAGRLTRSVKGVAEGVGSIVAPMAAVIGVGSIAGITALVTEWGRMGTEVASTSRNLGMATSDLQSLRSAAQMAGVSSESLTSGLASIGDSLNDAQWGRNQGAIVLMSRLGMRIHRTASGSVDAVRSLKDLAGAIGNIRSADTQRYVARQFGVEALLPLLRQGSKAIDEYQKKAAEMGGVQSQAAIDQAAAFGLQLNYLSVATQGLRNSIAEKLIPVVSPLLEQLTKWISKNRELIVNTAVNFVKGFAVWVQKIDFNKVLDGATRLIKSVDSIVDKLGGWKSVAIGLGVVMTASLLAPVVSLAASLSSLTLTTIPAAIRALGLLAGAGAAPAATTAAAGLGAAEAAAGAGAVAGGIGKGAFLGRLGLYGILAYELYQTFSAAKGLYDINHREGVQLSSDAAARVAGGALSGVANPFVTPLGIRSNNPLNIQRNGGEAVYPTMEAGISAAYKDLYGKIGRGINTPAAIVNAWSPPNAKGNSPEANANYAKFIEGAIGAGPIDRDNQQTMAKLISTMARFENGVAATERGGVDAALQHVVVEFKNAPPGTTATAKAKDGTAGPVRIVMAMPSGGMP